MSNKNVDDLLVFPLADDLVTAGERALERSGIEEHPILGSTAIAVFLYSWGYEIYAQTPDGKMKTLPPQDLDGLAMGMFLGFRDLVPQGHTVVVARDSEGVEVRVSKRHRAQSVM